MAGLQHALRAVRGLIRLVHTWAQRPRLVLTVWTVVIAVLAGGVGVLWWDDHRQDQTVTAAEDAVDAAEQHVAAILSYRHTTIDRDVLAARQRLTGSFADEFATLADGVFGPAAERDEIDMATRVVASSTVSAAPREVVALVYVNQTIRGKNRSEPQSTTSRLRVTLVERDGRWLVSGLKPV